jgi:hypothetical protein
LTGGVGLFPYIYFYTYLIYFKEKDTPILFKYMVEHEREYIDRF